MEGYHKMITRSKKKSGFTTPSPPPSEDYEENDVDENGNIKALIDYNCNEEFDSTLLEAELQKLRGDTTPKKYSKKIKKKKKKQKISKMSDILMSYILHKANLEMKRNKTKSSKHKEESAIDIYLDIEEDQDSEEPTSGEESDDSESELIDNDIDIEEEEEEGDETEEGEEEGGEEEDEEEEESDEDIEYDEYDDKYEDLLEKYENINSEDYDMEYFQKLNTDVKIKYLDQIEKVYDINENETPLRFKLLSSDMDIKTKSIAISNLDKLKEMDVSTGEYSKMDTWINGLIKIPFGKYVSLPISNQDTFETKQSFIRNTLDTLDTAIYGHKEAKTHILQVIGKWIRNPDSLGNVLALQGPMGNGKTTLVKSGIAKALHRPFAFITLGGASDSAFFDGHSYTYEGSHWGRIIQILQDSKYMNPIIYFDELDKISDTQKGDEIIHMLTHLTDASQNSLFQDNYFPGIDIDLSKVLFIFSFNDETKVNKILKDRMYVINTKGFQLNDKIIISQKYLLPDLYTNFSFTKDEIIFTNEILTYIISNYTDNEEGVRNLKRCIETIISKINIYLLTHSEDDNMSDKLSFTIKNFKLPITLTQEHIDNLLKVKNTDKAPSHMYM